MRSDSHPSWRFDRLFVKWWRRHIADERSEDRVALIQSRIGSIWLNVELREAFRFSETERWRDRASKAGTKPGDLPQSFRAAASPARFKRVT